MKEFRDVLDECGLMDLGYVGDKFTWRGKRAGGLVLERLDRAVASNGWFPRFPGSKVQHLRTHSSDHKAFLSNRKVFSLGQTAPSNLKKCGSRRAAVVTRWLGRGDQLHIVQICSRLLGKFKLAGRSSQLGVSSLLAVLST